MSSKSTNSNSNVNTRSRQRVGGKTKNSNNVHAKKPAVEPDLESFPLPRVKKGDFLEWSDMGDFMEVQFDSENGLFSWSPTDRKWTKMEFT